MKVEQANLLDSTALFSEDRKYRYTLERHWNPANGLVQFIGLNPSTADEYVNDPTVKKCIKYAKSWGYGGMIMTNIFAWRDTNPLRMKQVAEPIGGEENDAILMRIAKMCKITVCCWGSHGSHMNRQQQVLKLFEYYPLYFLQKSDDGLYPRHPLYLKDILTPTLWTENR